MYSTRTHHAFTNTPRAHALIVTVTHSLTHYIYYHTHHALTTQLLNHHSLITFSLCTHLPPLSYHTITHSPRCTHTLTHSSCNPAPITHTHTHTQHVITYRSHTHTLNKHSHTQQTLSHSTNTRDALDTHSCVHSSLTQYSPLPPRIVTTVPSSITN